MSLNTVYKTSLTLLTDLYQLTMSYGYWKNNIHNNEAVFNLFYRKQPFGGGYAVCAGLESVIDYIQNLRFSDDDLSYLRNLKDYKGEMLFDDAFIDFLSKMKLEIDIDAIPEGKVIFPNLPLIRVKGPLWQCQLIESALLNIVNFQTLIATKAARIKTMAKDNKVLEFGMRRAQGVDGALSASRASYIGGADATSNVLAGKIYGIPVSGTHAHSWILSFDSEMDAFRAYADAMPNNCVLLVDTFNSLKGIENAIEVGLELKSKGKELLGIRLDSGDLAYLSKRARQMLDDAGLNNTKIIVSNDLDELLLSSLKAQGAEIDTWGIGTKLVTAFDQAALGGVYKLSAIKKGDTWTDKIKLSEQNIKINIPGILQVRRFKRNGKIRFDMIYDTKNPPLKPPVVIDPADATRKIKVNDENFEHYDLLVPVFRKGGLVYEKPPIEEIRNNVLSDLSRLDPGHKRLEYPHIYPVGLEEDLYEKRLKLILELRENNKYENE